MRKNIQKVLDAFLARRSARGDAKGTCSTNGSSIYSYALEIARWNPDGSVWIYPGASTRTTNSQISACRRTLCHLLEFCDRHEDCRAYPELARACATRSRERGERDRSRRYTRRFA